MKSTTNIFGTSFSTNGLLMAFIVLVVFLTALVNNEVAGASTELANTLMK